VILSSLELQNDGQMASCMVVSHAIAVIVGGSGKNHFADVFKFCTFAK